MCAIMKTLRSKVEVRNYAQKKVKELSEKAKEKRTFEIIELLKKNKAFLNAQKVGLYYPLKDEVNILKIMEIFEKLNNEGISIVIVTHDINIATRCKKIIRMENGRVVN